MLLRPEEIRVLACLVEKERTTPGQYPLSEHAVLLACNQSTNREPVVTYDVTTVRRALVSLREQGLARTVHRTGERASKHRHLLGEALALDDAQLAVMAVLMLRGPQTPGELRTRTERLVPMPDVATVEQVLAGLAERVGGPLVQRLARVPGQKESRWADVVRDEPGDAGRADSSGEPGDAPASTAAPYRPSHEAERARTPLEALTEEVATLRDEVARLRAIVEQR